MIHYTMNTGHSRVSPRDEIADLVIARLARMMSTGVHPIPEIPGGYTFEVAGSLSDRSMMGTIWSAHHHPLVTLAVAPDEQAADSIWPKIVLLHRQLAAKGGPVALSRDMVHRQPPTTPWVAGLVIVADPDEAYWIADFERCFAWAWIEHTDPRRN